MSSALQSEKIVHLVEPRGFCFGVDQALKTLDHQLQELKSPIAVYNEIVHNKIIVESYKKKGVIFTQSLEAIPSNACVLISAHGIAPKIKKDILSQFKTVIDATCPLVQKVHDSVNTLTQDGYHVLYIGTAQHDEVRGVMGENPENITLIQTWQDIKQISKSYDKYAILSQTTLNYEDVNTLVEMITTALSPKTILSEANICNASTKRQEAVRQWAKQCDTLLVLGSQNSSNAKKLKEIAIAEGCPAYLLDRWTELDPKWLENVSTIAITSGASTPEYLVEELLSHLINNYHFVYDKKS